MDHELHRRVILFLQQKDVPSLSQLTIEVDDGHVMLQGTVRSFYERQLCLTCRHVAGVTRVIDDLKVVVPPSQPIPRIGSDAGVPARST